MTIIFLEHKNLVQLIFLGSEATLTWVHDSLIKEMRESGTQGMAMLASICIVSGFSYSFTVKLAVVFGL